MPAFLRSFSLGIALILSVTFVSARNDIKQERVQFAGGTSEATVRNTINGRETIDYLLGAKAGQSMRVTLEADNTATYFNVLPPDSEVEAVFTSTTGGRIYEGVLHLDGDWKIRVYLYRAAARRGETTSYSLDVSVLGNADPSAAREASTFGPHQWDARGDLYCFRGDSKLELACPFKVVRNTYGAAIWTLKPGGGIRVLYFENGEYSTDNASPIQVAKESDMWTVVVGDETYRFPDAVIGGG
jgi:hypothetical protein